MYIARMRRINTYHEHPCCYCFGTLNLPDSRMPKQSALDAFYYVRNTFYRIAAAKLQQKIDICKCRWRKIYFSANNCAIFYYFVYSLVVLFFFSSVLNVRFSGHGPVMILFPTSHFYAGGTAVIYLQTAILVLLYLQLDEYNPMHDPLTPPNVPAVFPSSHELHELRCRHLERQLRIYHLIYSLLS